MSAINPARAGMIPTARTCRVTLVSKPRASGDDPAARLATRSATW